MTDETRQSIINYLVINNFIVVNGDQVILRGKALELFDIEAQEEPSILNGCLSWIDNWIALWPKGVKSGGRPVRSSRQSIITKMNTLISNKKYKPQDIIDCTKAYLDDFESRQWHMVTCADYFISKNRSSLLEALLEEFDRSTFEQESNGEGHFHKLL